VAELFEAPLCREHYEWVIMKNDQFVTGTDLIRVQWSSNIHEAKTFLTRADCVFFMEDFSIRVAKPYRLKIQVFRTLFPPGK
jgi:hypothetical protein